MNPDELNPIARWEAVALSRSLKSRPLRVFWNGLAIALFRAGGDIRCVLDRCPHRSAPLSRGRVVDNTLECPYHGWRFSGSGVLAALPCHIGALPRVIVPSFSACERDGLIFVARRKPERDPYVRLPFQGESISMKLENRVRSSLADVAENILDATHTHFTHKGILRGLSARRHKVTVTVTGGDDWVEAVYEGEPRQDGLVSRLLEGDRGKGVGRFMAPGIAELEFWGKNGLNLATTFHLRQETPETVHGLAILSGPKQGYLGYLKAAALRPFFQIALKQDQTILEGARDNATLFGDPRPVIGPLDILRSHIDAILAGKRPDVADQKAQYVMEL